MEKKHSKYYVTKAELQEKVNHLEKEIERLQAIIDYRDREVWGKKIDLAFLKAKEVLNLSFRNAYSNLRYIRVDKVGYWFSYRVDNVDYTLRVGHNDVSFVD